MARQVQPLASPDLSQEALTGPLSLARLAQEVVHGLAHGLCLA